MLTYCNIRTSQLLKLLFHSNSYHKLIFSPSRNNWVQPMTSPHLDFIALYLGQHKRHSVMAQNIPTA